MKMQMGEESESAKPDHTIIESMMTYQKFDALKELIVSMMEDFSTLHHYFFFMLYCQGSQFRFEDCDEMIKWNFKKEDTSFKGLVDYIRRDRH